MISGPARRYVDPFRASIPIWRRELTLSPMATGCVLIGLIYHHVSTQDVLSRFVAALGGTLKLIADFGDEMLKIA